MVPPVWVMRMLEVFFLYNTNNKKADVRDLSCGGVCRFALKKRGLLAVVVQILGSGPEVEGKPMF